MYINVMVASTRRVKPGRRTSTKEMKQPVAVAELIFELGFDPLCDLQQPFLAGVFQEW